MTINEKMVAKNSSGSFLKTLLITSILLSQIILILILYQAFQNGQLTEENIKQRFESVGLYPVFECLQKANGAVWKGVYWIDEKLEGSFPGYLKIITNAVEPYVDLTLKLRKILRIFSQNVYEYTLENYPIVLQNIEYYAPGLVENSQKVLSQAYSSFVSYYNFSKDYLSQKVFVNQFSLENVQRVIFEALYTIRQKASEYYYWIYDKVQTTIK